MRDELKEIKKQLSIDKEIIEVSPKTGIKHIKVLSKTLEEMKETYENMQEQIIKEITNRYNKIMSVTKNTKIDTLKEEIEKLAKLTSISEQMTPIEKMRLDDIMYSINGYYKKNLVIINKDIYKAIKKFAEVNIKLTSKDFGISNYSEKYIEVLIEEAKKEDINSEKVKETFEKIYSQCSDIIYHIYVNIRCIYNKNEKEIERFFKKQEEEQLVEYNSTKEELTNKKEELIKEEQEIEQIDDKIILDSFFNEILNINEYTKENYEKAYQKLTNKKSTEFSEKQKSEMDSNIAKLYRDLKEYQNYLKYKFIEDEVTKIRKIKENANKQEKDKKSKNKKSEYELQIQNVKNITEEIFKLNKEIRKKAFGLKKISDSDRQKNILERNNKIVDLKNEFIRLNRMETEQRIETTISSTSTVLDVLKFATYNYEFLAKIIIKQFPEIKDSEISDMIKEIREFITFSTFSVINNINVEEHKEISVIIKDKYKMFGMSLSKEDFEEANLEDLIKQAQIVTKYNDIQKSNLKVEEIKFVLQAQGLFNTKK